MSDFEAKIHEVIITKHPNADSLEIANIGGYQSIVQKNTFKTGNLVAYIQENSIVPDDVLEEMGLTGRLAGKQKNRVKAIKLRGVVSQGLIYPVTGSKLKNHIDDLKVGNVVTEELGLVKYEPPIPLHMRGEIQNLHGHTLKFDIENIKKYPLLFETGEHIIITEKIHGTWCCLGYDPIKGPIVSSKGMSAKGLAFKLIPENETNLYVRAWHQHKEKVMELVNDYGCPVYVLGEVYGRGVQDLYYDALQPEFAAFDIYIGKPGSQGGYLDSRSFFLNINEIEMPYVPVLYNGPFSKEIVEKYTNGKSVFDNSHIREGVVIKSTNEFRKDGEIGRRMLKSVSEDYLLRKGKTTEFQ